MPLRPLFPGHHLLMFGPQSLNRSLELIPAPDGRIQHSTGAIIEHGWIEHPNLGDGDFLLGIEKSIGVPLPASARAIRSARVGLAGADRVFSRSRCSRTRCICLAPLVMQPQDLRAPCSNWMALTTAHPPQLHEHFQ